MNPIKTICGEPGCTKLRHVTAGGQRKKFCPRHQRIEDARRWGLRSSGHVEAKTARPRPLQRQGGQFGKPIEPSSSPHSQGVRQNEPTAAELRQPGRYSRGQIDGGAFGKPEIKRVRPRPFIGPDQGIGPVDVPADMLRAARLERIRANGPGSNDSPKDIEASGWRAPDMADRIERRYS